METELVVLANTAAVALVTLMAADSWEQAKTKVTGLFRHGSAAQKAEQDLEAARTQLTSAQPGSIGVLRSAIEAEWASAFWRLLQSEPGAAAVLQELRAQSEAGKSGRIGAVTNINHGNVRFGSVIQAGQIYHNTPDTVSDEPQ